MLTEFTVKFTKNKETGHWSTYIEGDSSQAPKEFWYAIIPAFNATLTGKIVEFLEKYNKHLVEEK